MPTRDRHPLLSHSMLCGREREVNSDKKSAPSLKSSPIPIASGANGSGSPFPKEKQFGQSLISLRHVQLSERKGTNTAGGFETFARQIKQFIIEWKGKGGPGPGFGEGRELNKTNK